MRMNQRDEQRCQAASRQDPVEPTRVESSTRFPWQRRTVDRVEQRGRT